MQLQLQAIEVYVDKRFVGRDRQQINKQIYEAACAYSKQTRAQRPQ